MLAETRPAKVGKWTEPALRVLRERYLAREGGEVAETPEEMCWRGAPSLAAGEAPHGRSPAAGPENAPALHAGVGGRGLLAEPPPPMKAGEGQSPQDPARSRPPV